jgi:hypothetical protein
LLSFDFPTVIARTTGNQQWGCKILLPPNGPRCLSYWIFDFSFY